jgi:mono/diheme cytochrome c family protein
VKRLGLAAALMALVSVGAGPEASFGSKLPAFGARRATLPAGPGRDVAARACLTCHSSDILRQQRLTEAQWAASVKKMTGWGAEVSEEEKDVLVKYLSSHFGTDNDRFRPVVTRPIGR